MLLFNKKNRQESQNFNNDTLYRPPVASAQWIIETEKFPDNSILLKYDDDDYSQGYGQIKETFGALTKEDILLPKISDNDFRSSNDDNDIDYNFYNFGIRHQKNLQSAQPIEVDFKFSKRTFQQEYKVMVWC